MGFRERHEARESKKKKRYSDKQERSRETIGYSNEEKNIIFLYAYIR